MTDSITGEVIDRVVAQPVPWHRRQSTGDLITRAGVDAEAATAMLHPLPFATSVIVMIVLSSVWLLVTDGLLGLAAVAVFPVLIVLNVVYQRRVDRFFNAAQDELGQLSSAVHESFDGVTVVKSFGAERRETERLAEIAARLRQERMGAVRIRATFESLLDGIPNAVNVLLLVGGAYRVSQGAMTVGDVASFIFLFTLLVFPLRLIGFALSELPHSLAGWNRIRELLDQPVEPDPAAALAHGETNEVRLDDVHYRYDANRPLLVGVSAVVPAGRTVAVVGATGAGKTTLLNLIAGMVGPESGVITVPHGETLLVLQEPFLLAGSARENITMGLDLDDATIAAALSVAEATFLAHLPDGLDTEVGERGVGLSGGQRQRLALARALVRRPAVLLLDDTTSALDPTTEAKVLANLRALAVRHHGRRRRLAPVDDRPRRRRAVPRRRDGGRPRPACRADGRRARLPRPDRGVRARPGPASRRSARDRTHVEVVGRCTPSGAGCRRRRRCAPGSASRWRWRWSVPPGGSSSRSSCSRRSTTASPPAACRWTRSGPSPRSASP